MRYVTDAPEAYDYDYVATVATFTDRFGHAARVVEESDAYRFENWQAPRYSSGLHYCWPLGSKDAEYAMGDFRVPEPAVTAVPSLGLPEEYRALHDEVVAALAADPDFAEPVSVTQNPHCGLWLRDGTDLPCLVAAQDSLGNWTVLTRKGEVRQFLASEVR